jgi:hypothetical protein
MYREEVKEWNAAVVRLQDGLTKEPNESSRELQRRLIVEYQARAENRVNLLAKKSTPLRIKAIVAPADYAKLIELHPPRGTVNNPRPTNQCPPMFDFAIVLVFGAYPDFWLSDADFEKANFPLRMRTQGVNGQRELIASYGRSITKWPEDKAHYIQKIVESNVKLDRYLHQLDIERVVQRASTLINSQRYRH